MNWVEQIDDNLIKRHNRKGPRYTSYPTVPEWSSGQYHADYLRFLEREKGLDKELSIYIHIPFCRKLCTFCGCNRVITQDQEKINRYIRILKIEIKELASVLGRKKVKQLHFGGGTPTYLSIEQFEGIIDCISQSFDLAEEGEFAIEAHPGVTQKAQLEMLYKHGFKRISFGVQDLNPAVQKAINREQSEEDTVNMFKAAREIGFDSINIDLVYGLPKQSIEGFKKTLETIHKLGPDRLAVYSFAYIPGMFKTHERAIHPSDLPLVEEKIALYLEAIRFFTKHNYAMIGMDHYAKKTDELALALDNKKLHRNFMGYTTLKGLTQIGLGASAISDFGDGYFQNEKNIPDYEESISNKSFPSIRKIELSQDDVIRRDVIDTLMCHGFLDIPEFEKTHQIVFSEYFESAIQALEKYQDEGLVHLNTASIEFTHLGILFSRILAMPFDAYIEQDKNTHFSSTI